MANFNLQGPPQFPVGTSVAAYPVSNWNGAEITGTPVGSATDTKTVSATGVAAFTGLAANTRYVAYAQVSSQDRYVRFSTSVDADSGDGQGEDAAHDTVSVGTSATLLRAANSGRSSLLLKNTHATNILYLGDTSSVSTGNGFPIGAGESILVPTKGAVYGIASGASTDVRFFEVT